MPAQNAKDIEQMLLAGQSPRYQRIDAYQRHWDGTIYDGRPGFLDQSIDVPLLERAPCVVYPLVRAAIQSNVSLCIGEGRFPQILSLTNEDDSAFDDRFGLNGGESEIVDAANAKIVDQARLTTVSQQLLESAMAAGSVVFVVSIDRGRLKVSQLDAKVCTPGFMVGNTDELDSLTVSYRYVEDYFDAQSKKYSKRVMQFRRVIDRQSDTTYKPVEVRNKDDYPTPGTVDKDKTFTHGFGFCPARWYAFRQVISDIADIDGRPIHWGLASQLDALHFSLSQRHRAAMYCGDPQYFETGVASDETPAPMGRAAIAAQPTANNPQGRPMNNGWAFGSDPSGRSGGAKRKKGPGAVWSYEDPAAKVGMMTLPGDALKAIDMHIADLRSKICEALGVTFIDPATLRGTADISGKALAVIYANQIAQCNAIREDFGRRCLLPMLNMLYRVVLATTDGLYLAGADKLRPILKRFTQPVVTTNAAGAGTARMQWFDPTLTLKWGAYFEPSDVDQATKLNVVTAALAAKVITTASAVEYVKDVFGIKNVAQYLDQLADETAQKQADAIANAAAMASAVPSGPSKPISQGAKPGNPDPQPGKPKPGQSGKK